MSESAGLTKTNHPYIVQSHDVCGGSPVLEGTRTRVIDIAIEYTMLGRSPDEIIDAHPYLDLAKVVVILNDYSGRRFQYTGCGQVMNRSLSSRLCRCM
ncbi:DUF433 domain-containing protein [Candidatus Poribacteria bacterium]